MDEAQEAFVKALKRMPFNAMAHKDLGRTLLAQGKFHAALGHLEDSLRIKPNDPEWHCFTVIAYNRTENGLKNFNAYLGAAKKYLPHNKIVSSFVGIVRTLEPFFKKISDQKRVDPRLESKKT